VRPCVVGAVLAARVCRVSPAGKIGARPGGRAGWPFVAAFGCRRLGGGWGR